MKNHILFLDWHDTLSGDIFFSSLRNSFDSATQKTGHDIANLLFSQNPDLIRNWMTGHMCSEDIIRFTSDKLNLDYETLWSAFVSDCKAMAMMPGLTDQLYPLKDFYHLVLITANMDCFNRFTRPHNRIDDHCDLIVNSCDYGFLKTDQNGRAFTEVCDLYGITAKDSILIDDSQSVGDVFTALGGRYRKVRNPAETAMILTELNQHHKPLKRFN